MEEKRGHNFIDMTGKKYGRLTVIQFTHMNEDKKACWLCKCDCGNKKIIVGRSIRQGKILSCKCLWKDSISLPPREASLNKHFLDYKIGAKKRSFLFKLTKYDFKKLTSGNCYYCNSKPRTLIWKNKMNGIYKANGIDRVNNKNGYILKNCVTCCKTCNIAKAKMSKKLFLSWIERVYNVHF